MQLHIKFGIPGLNNIEKIALNIIILKTRSEVKVTVTQKGYATLGHPKKHPHTKFGIPTSKNIEIIRHNYPKIYVRGQGHSDP